MSVTICDKFLPRGLFLPETSQYVELVTDENTGNHQTHCDKSLETMNVCRKCMKIYWIVFELFQSGLRWWTGWPLLLWLKVTESILPHQHIDSLLYHKCERKNHRTQVVTWKKAEIHFNTLSFQFAQFGRPEPAVPHLSDTVSLKTILKSRSLHF